LKERVSLSAASTGHGKEKNQADFENLKGRAEDIVARLTNSIALQNDDCCTVEDFAEKFYTTPGRLKTTLTRL
jgi:hypothetical protein